MKIGVQSSSTTPSKCQMMPLTQSMKYLPDGADHLLIPTKNFLKMEISTDSREAQNQLAMLNWRSKTQFPIVKVLFYKILSKKLTIQEKKFQVAFEVFPHTLATLPKLPFSQVLYLLKESMIGYERLYQRFGPFEITSKMIFINKNSKCKVWIHEQIEKNTPQKTVNLSQEMLIKQVLGLFQQKSMRTSISMNFYYEVQKFKSFLEILCFIDSFAKKYKLIIATSVSLSTQPITPEKKEKKEKKQAERRFNKQLIESTKNVPFFIQKIREDKNKKFLFSSIKENHSQRFTGVKKNPENELMFSQKREKTEGRQRTEENADSDYSPNSPTTLSQRSFDAAKKASKSNSYFALKRFPLLKKSFQTEKFEKSLPRSPAQEDFYNRFDYGKNESRFQAAEDRFMESTPSKNFNFASKKMPQKSSSNYCSTTESSQTKIQFQSKQRLKALIQHQQKDDVSDSLKEEQIACIFQKNGWIKTLSLEDKSARESLRSIHDGEEQIRHESLLYQDVMLNLLGTMGKSLKGSIIVEDFR